MRRHAKMIMNVADTNNDGKLCINEFMYGLIQEGEAFEELMLKAYNFLFTELDFDGDGQATFRDFLWTGLRAKGIKMAMKSGKEVGRTLPGTFSIDNGGMILEASMDQTTSLKAGGGDILQVGKHLVSVIRMEKGKNIYIDRPWELETSGELVARLIDKVEVLKIIGLKKSDLQAIEIATAEEPPPLDNAILKKEFKNANAIFSRLIFADPLSQAYERKVSVLIHQFIVKAPSMPEVICLRSPYCNDILDVGSCLKTVCTSFCQSNSPLAGNLCGAKTPLDWRTYAVSLRSLPCIRKYWGQTRRMARQKKSNYRNKEHIKE